MGFPEVSERYYVYLSGSGRVTLIDFETGHEEIHLSPKSLTDRLAELGIKAVQLLSERPAIAH